MCEPVRIAGASGARPSILPNRLPNASIRTSSPADSMSCATCSVAAVYSRVKTSRVMPPAAGSLLIAARSSSWPTIERVGRSACVHGRRLTLAFAGDPPGDLEMLVHEPAGLVGVAHADRLDDETVCSQRASGLTGTRQRRLRDPRRALGDRAEQLREDRVARRSEDGRVEHAIAGKPRLPTRDLGVHLAYARDHGFDVVGVAALRGELRGEGLQGVADDADVRKVRMRLEDVGGNGRHDVVDRADQHHAVAAAHRR